MNEDRILIGPLTRDMLIRGRFDTFDVAEGVSREIGELRRAQHDYNGRRALTVKHWSNTMAKEVEAKRFFSYFMGPQKPCPQISRYRRLSWRFYRFIDRAKDAWRVLTGKAYIAEGDE